MQFPKSKHEDLAYDLEIIKKIINITHVIVTSLILEEKEKTFYFYPSYKGNFERNL